MVMHHDRGPVSRVYATVLEPGTVRVGDAAILEPPDLN
jgi:MOSC domain-containing protein YiiM